jgi:transcriptional regulator with XRE-family HTH domain
MDLGLTQRTLAEKLGCWDVTVAAWERDESIPLASSWPSIEAVLGSGLVPEHDGIAGAFRTGRLRLGLTHLELATRAGLDVRTIRNVERSIHPPSRLTLRKLRTILGNVRAEVTGRG